MVFNTNLEIDPKIKIIALSDVHGDIDSLIIALRDCAGIIDHDNPDLLRKLLFLDLNNREEAAQYTGNESLGFQWIGRQTHVVLIGDTLDNVRLDSNRNPITPKKRLADGRQVFISNEYPQVELKIILLLNALDQAAERVGGKVIKLIGNHEAGNFELNDTNNLSSVYAANPTEIYSQYYPFENRLRRIDYFKLNNPGFKLFMSRGSGVILKINNYIFVHGQLDGKRTFKDFNAINSWLNSGVVNEQTSPGQLFLDLSNDQAGALWGREYGDSYNSDYRIQTRNKGFCKNVEDNIKTFCTGIRCDIPNTKIIIGHCPQSFTLPQQKNTTFNNKTDIGHITILNPPSITNVADVGNDFVFGITMECDIEPTKPNMKHRIYKVDIGSSRAFDSEASYNESLSEKGFKEQLLGRMPQVLEINGDIISIVRSNIKNTMAHQKRDLLEAKIKSDPRPDPKLLELLDLAQPEKSTIQPVPISVSSSRPARRPSTFELLGLAKPKKRTIPPVPVSLPSPSTSTPLPSRASISPPPLPSRASISSTSTPLPSKASISPPPSPSRASISLPQFPSRASISHPQSPTIHNELLKPASISESTASKKLFDSLRQSEISDRKRKEAYELEKIRRDVAQQQSHESYLEEEKRREERNKIIMDELRERERKAQSEALKIKKERQDRLDKEQAEIQAIALEDERRRARQDADIQAEIRKMENQNIYSFRQNIPLDSNPASAPPSQSTRISLSPRYSHQDKITKMDKQNVYSSEPRIPIGSNSPPPPSQRPRISLSPRHSLQEGGNNEINYQIKYEKYKYKYLKLKQNLFE